MNFYEFCQQNVAVYGAGAWGKRVYATLRKLNIIPCCYIVTRKDENEAVYIDEIPVLSIDVFLQKNIDKNIGIIIAVSEKYRNDITEILISRNVTNFYCCSNTYLMEQEYYRGMRPLNSENFFMTDEPIDDHFGVKRGKPIDRYYIENFLEKESKRIKIAQNILEVGESTYSKRYFPSALKMDIVDETSGWNLTDISTLPQNYYDVFICTQTLNFIYDIKAAIKGCYYLLKYGGTLLATVAGNISQVCVNDNYTHYWNFTAICIKNLMDEVFGKDNVQVFPFGNIMSATGFIQGVAFEELPNPELLDKRNDGVYSITIGIVAGKDLR